MKVKVKRTIIFVIIALILLFGVFLYFKPFQQAVLGTCNIVASGTTVSQFTCESSSCTVNGWDNCLEKQEIIGNVIARTNINLKNMTCGNYGCTASDMYNYFKTNTLELDVNPSILGNSGDTTSLSTLFNVFLSYSTSGYSHTNVLFWFDQKDKFDRNWRMSVVSTSGDYLIEWTDGSQYYSFRLSKYGNTNPRIPIVISSIPEYAVNKQEAYTDGLTSSISTSYQCQEQWQILTSSGSVKTSGTASYSSNTFGKYQTGSKTLSTNEKFIFSKNIDYSVVDLSNACTISKCNDLKTGYYNCIKDANGCNTLSTQLTSCPSNTCQDTLSGAKCADVFSVSGELLDSKYASKTTFSAGETIFFKTLITSSIVNTATVRVSLEDLNNNIIATKNYNMNFPNTNPLEMSFAGINDSGDYKVVLRISSADKIFEQEFPLRVSNPITIVIRAFDENTGTKLYTNNDFTIQVRVFDSSSSPTTGTTTLVTSLNGVSINAISSNSPSLGVYDFKYKVDKDGLFKVQATVDKFGYKIINNQEYVVNPSDIKIAFMNINSIQNVVPGEYTIRFETTDPQDNLISTQNTVSILQPEGRTVILDTIDGSNGEYSFDYNFATQGGYKIKVSSSATSYTSKVLESPFINIVESGKKYECVSSSECDTNQVCTNNECIEQKSKTNYSLYIIIFLFLVIIGLVIYFIKKK